MENYKNTKVISCLGDGVRYDFIQKLTRFPLKDYLVFETKDIVIYHGEKEQLLIEENMLIIYTNKMPLGRVLQVPKWAFYSKSLISREEKDVEKVLIFNSFPYPKQNILEELETMVSEMETTDIEMVLYIEERKFAASDIGSEIESINFAIKTYQKFIKDVGVFNEGENPFPLLSVVPRLVSGLSNTYQRGLRQIEYRLKKRYDTRYLEEIQNEVDLYFDILNPEEFEKLLKIFEYPYIKGSNDIWKQYCENFKNIYLYGEYEIMSTLVEFYLEYLVDIYGWGIENEKKHIEDRLLNCFNEVFKYPKKLLAPKTEIEYRQLLAREPLNVEFQRLIKKFFYKEAKSEILSALQEKLDSISRKIRV